MIVKEPLLHRNCVGGAYILVTSNTGVEEELEAKANTDLQLIDIYLGPETEGKTRTQSDNDHFKPRRSSE